MLPIRIVDIGRRVTVSVYALHRVSARLRPKIAWIQAHVVTVMKRGGNQGGAALDYSGWVSRSAQLKALDCLGYATIRLRTF